MGEKRVNVFGGLFPLCKKIVNWFSGVIDVERKNGVKKWICCANREAMENETLDAILRIYCNAPSGEDEEELRVWLIEVAKVFWMAAERRIECAELDDMCAGDEGDDGDADEYD